MPTPFGGIMDAPADVAENRRRIEARGPPAPGRGPKSPGVMSRGSSTDESPKNPESPLTSRWISIKYSGDGADRRRGLASPGQDDSASRPAPCSGRAMCGLMRWMKTGDGRNGERRFWRAGDLDPTF